MEKDIAIKVLNAAHTDSEKFQLDFQTEIKTLKFNNYNNVAYWTIGLWIILILFPFLVSLLVKRVLFLLLNICQFVYSNGFNQTNLKILSIQ